MARVNAGFCASCSHAETITSVRESIFCLCRLSFRDLRFARYPQLPVLTCTGYEAREKETRPQEGERHEV